MGTIKDPRQAARKYPWVERCLRFPLPSVLIHPTVDTPVCQFYWEQKTEAHIRLRENLLLALFVSKDQELQSLY